MNQNQLKAQPPGRGAEAAGLRKLAGASISLPHDSTKNKEITLQLAPDPLTIAEWCELESTRLKTLAEYIRTTEALALLGEV